jgi:hypothetical protein
MTAYWVTSAKQEDTRRRLGILIEKSANGENPGVFGDVGKRRRAKEK